MAILDNQTTAPSTHVLIVGVDDYKHLPREDGGGPQVAGHEYAPGLTKISTAAPSAQRLANWFLNGFTNPQRPLGSLDVLLSTGAFSEGAKPPTAVATPTFENLKTAFRQWRDRCAAHDNNHAIFYFCGHGFEESSHYLLPEDALDDPGDVTGKFIDFDATLTLMGQCRARAQLYFVDACRSPFSKRLQDIRKAAMEAAINQGQAPRPLGKALLGNEAGPFFEPRNAVIYKSAGRKGAPAKSRRGQESYFVEALIECLKNFGAANDFGSGEHWVRIESLRDALQERMRRSSRKNSLEEVGFDFDPFRFNPNLNPDLHLIASPIVQTKIQLDPSSRHTETTIELEGPKKYSCPPGPGPWEHEMEPGIYDVTFNFDPPLPKRGPMKKVLSMPVYPAKWPLP